eukprot:TRINITY_DN63275_c0_g1_i1.p1 TRINITY_DN63275_c0_g1~~TRINITY_DN63275_c0_g1_i1.p1  ORF type:complete len:1051 (-),score=140.73 TRINITY_DN63275_c0_g1_i1:165-3317(-)
MTAPGGVEAQSVTTVVALGTSSAPPLTDGQELPTQWDKSAVDESVTVEKVLKEILSSRDKNENGVDLHGSFPTPFEASLWSSVLLCAFARPNGESLLSRSEVWVTISCTVVCAIFQAVLVLVIFFNMLENPYSPEVIQEMLQWRVNEGHKFANVDANFGRTLVNQLCSGGSWSYAGNEYQETVAYLDGQVPGWLLAGLAISLWTCYTMQEFRIIMEQVNAIFLLPQSNRGETEIGVTDDEKLEVVGISRKARWCLLLLVQLPRFFILACLAWTGILYLSLTVNLSDLVLNAMALGFVLDVDELLFSLFATRRTLAIMDNMEPLRCTVTVLPGGILLIDLARAVIFFSVIVLGIIYGLIPFMADVQAASQALCGGDLDFSTRFESASSYMTVVQHDSTHVDCIGGDLDKYMEKVYGIKKTVLAGSSKEERFNREASNTKRLRSVMAYAYRISNEDMSPSLLKALDEHDVEPGVGATAVPRPCNRFDAALGISTCTQDPTTEDACLWSYESYLCEGFPSLTNPQSLGSGGTGAINRVKEEACLERPRTERSCDWWLSKDVPNPVAACAPTALQGQIRIKLLNYPIFKAFITNVPLAKSLLEEGLGQVLQIAKEYISTEMFLYPGESRQWTPQWPQIHLRYTIKFPFPLADSGATSRNSWVFLNAARTDWIEDNGQKSPQWQQLVTAFNVAVESLVDRGDWGTAVLVSTVWIDSAPEEPLGWMTSQEAPLGWETTLATGIKFLDKGRCGVFFHDSLQTTCLYSGNEHFNGSGGLMYYPGDTCSATFEFSGWRKVVTDGMWNIGTDDTLFLDHSRSSSGSRSILPDVNRTGPPGADPKGLLVDNSTIVRWLPGANHSNPPDITNGIFFAICIMNPIASLHEIFPEDCTKCGFDICGNDFVQNKSDFEMWRYEKAGLSIEPSFGCFGCEGVTQKSTVIRTSFPDKRDPIERVPFAYSHLYLMRFPWESPSAHAGQPCAPRSTTTTATTTNSMSTMTTIYMTNTTNSTNALQQRLDALAVVVQGVLEEMAALKQELTGISAGISSEGQTEADNDTR